VFHVLLPIVAGPAEAPAAPPAHTAPLPRGTETVLLVEDESQVRDLHVTMLRTLGYHVLEAADGEEALRLAASTPAPIHLLVTDVIMPRVGGHELARRIREVRPAIRVLFASGYAEDAIAHDGVLEPGIHLLSKPFSPQDLAIRVRALIEAETD
jgi:CheY-like chemotaxis protein